MMALPEHAAVEAEAEPATVTDDQIARAIAQIDPMVLRGAMYQLTGREELKNIEVRKTLIGFREIDTVVNDRDERALRHQAEEWLRRHRDAHEAPAELGSLDRLRTSLALAAGSDFHEARFDFWLEKLALSHDVRSFKWP